MTQHQFGGCPRHGYVEQEALFRVALGARADRDLAAPKRTAQRLAQDRVGTCRTREGAFQQAADEDDGKFPLPCLLRVDQPDRVAAELGAADGGVAERRLRGPQKRFQGDGPVRKVRSRFGDGSEPGFCGRGAGTPDGDAFGGKSQCTLRLEPRRIEESIQPAQATGPGRRGERFRAPGVEASQTVQEIDHQSRVLHRDRHRSQAFQSLTRKLLAHRVLEARRRRRSSSQARGGKRGSKDVLPIPSGIQRFQRG